MRQGDEAGPIFLPGLHCFGQGCLSAVSKIMRVGILAQQNRQLHLRHSSEQFLVPGLGTLGPGWQISGPPCSRITEPHRDQRDPLRVVKLLRCDTKPVPQTIPTRIIPRDAGFVDTAARCLPNNENARAFVCGKNGARTSGQMLGADITPPHLPQQCRKLLHLSTKE